MKLGFVIDQDTCIGCHACTVACKAEHEVPLGVNRTWVKYVETGSFPDAQRHFAVMRCNHCELAPCVRICPTGALFRRPDGIVDFDTDNCIGCKACMNACPYDALYIDPETNTAQKCNFCAHRIEQDLAPSCVSVCPTQSIAFGDLDEPTSPVSRLLADHDLSVRSPEQGTRPKLFYKGAAPEVLDPTRSRIASDGMIWAETTASHPTLAWPDAGIDARTAYTTAHPTPWGWPVSAYLVTKGIASGVVVVGATLVALGHAGDPTVGVVVPVLAGVFTAVTGALLIGDLKQPKRFAYLLTRAQWGSWLVRGAVVLATFALACAAWFLAGVTGQDGLVKAVAPAAAVAAVATAGYTAFLFAQCEGRDLWQTPVLLPMLLAQAVACGGAVLALVDMVTDVPEPSSVRWALLGGVGLNLALVVVEVTRTATRNVELAIRAMTVGPFAGRFRSGVGAGVLAVGLTAPALGGGDTATALAALGAVMGLVSVTALEDAFVRAGQAVPLS